MNTDEEEFIIDETIPEPDPASDTEPVGNAQETGKTDKKEDETPKKKRNKVVAAFNNIYRFLSGDFLTKEAITKQFPFVIYIIFLLLILISSSYRTEHINNQIIKLDKEIEQLHAKSISLNNTIKKETRQSNLVKKLKAREIKEPIQPMIKIEANKTENDNPK